MLRSSACRFVPVLLKIEVSWVRTVLVWTPTRSA